MAVDRDEPLEDTGITKRELFSLVTLHALLTDPARTVGLATRDKAAKEAVIVADRLLDELQQYKQSPRNKL